MSTKYVTLETNRGRVVAELFDRDCPGTVENFERLANSAFYDGVKFHRVIEGMLVQTGDPLSRELPLSDPRVGTGGPGYAIRCETVGNRRRHTAGALSMAHQGKDSGGSQFFFVLDEAKGRDWNGVHTVFGQTREGLDVLRSIAHGDEVLQARVWE
jgi:peptidyl-prolyl cis-trans isomerase B (cyclophilin B)